MKPYTQHMLDAFKELPEDLQRYISSDNFVKIVNDTCVKAGLPQEKHPEVMDVVVLITLRMLDIADMAVHLRSHVRGTSQEQAEKLAYMLFNLVFIPLTRDFDIQESPVSEQQPPDKSPVTVVPPKTPETSRSYIDLTSKKEIPQIQHHPTPIKLTKIKDEPPLKKEKDSPQEKESVTTPSSLPTEQVAPSLLEENLTQKTKASQERVEVVDTGEAAEQGGDPYREPF